MRPLGYPVVGLVIVLGIVAAGLAGCRSEPHPYRPKISFQEHLLATLPVFIPSMEQTAPEFHLSPNGEKVAYPATKFKSVGDYGAISEGVMLVVADGNGSHESPLFDELGGIYFSPDGSRVACWATSKYENFLLFTDAAGSRFERVPWPPGRPPFAGSQPVEFSLDGTKVAYPLSDGEKRFVVVNGQRGAVFQSVGGLVFSPDGTKLAYTAYDGGRAFVVVDGQKGPEFGEVGPPVFAPDGTRVAYEASMESADTPRSQRKWFVVVGDQRGPAFSSTAQLVFSPKGDRVAYFAEQGEKMFVVVGTQAGPAFELFAIDWQRPPVFSPDGRRVAYVAETEPAGGEKRYTVVVDGRKGPAFSGIGSIVFSDDGTRLAYSASGESGGVILDDGRSTRTLFADDERQDYSSPLFSPDGRMVACVGRQNGKEFVVVDGKKGPGFDDVRLLDFDATGRRIAYGARQGREVWRRVMEVR